MYGAAENSLHDDIRVGQHHQPGDVACGEIAAHDPDPRPWPQHEKPQQGYLAEPAQQPPFMAAQPAPLTKAEPSALTDQRANHAGLPARLRPGPPRPRSRGSTRIDAWPVTQCFSQVPQPVQWRECTVGIMILRPSTSPGSRVIASPRIGQTRTQMLQFIPL